MANPTDVHFHLVKQIMRYLQGTMECGLHYTTTLAMDLQAYSDADWHQILIQGDQLLAM